MAPDKQIIGVKPAREQHETVLVVDDEPVNAALLKQCALNAGYRAIVANSGSEALEVVERDTVDLILLDIIMPGMDGMQVLEALRKGHSRYNLPVIMVTGLDDTTDFVHALDLGANDYILKPVNFSVVQARMRTNLELKHSVHHLEVFNHDLENLVQERTADLEQQVIETREAEEQLRQARKLEAVGQLAAGIAHEINSPMQFIRDNTEFVADAFVDVIALHETYQELLAAAKQGEVHAELIEKVEKAETEADIVYLAEEIPGAISQTRDGIGRVTNIVRAMKQFAHPGSSEKQPVDLNETIESAIIVSANAWKYVADLDADLEEGLPVILGFSQELNQVLLNVIVNASHAIKALDSDSKGKIRISTRSLQDAVELRISDTGCGIPDEIADRVFDPFFTTKEVGKGTGQGLAITYSIIRDKHGGDIEFESTSSGTTFIIRLPLGEDAESGDQVA